MTSLTQSAKDSQIAKYGNRYFKVDEGYDKRVYENTALNYVRIVATLLGFYAFHIVHWWALFEFGMHDSEAFTTYSIVIFCCSVVCIGAMLISGHFANINKAQDEFLREIIAEKLAAANEEKERKRQEDLYKQRLAAQAKDNQA